MTLSILVIVLAIGFWLQKGCHKRVAASFIWGALILFVAIGYGIPTQVLMTNLQSGYAEQVSNWRASNVIIVLGAGVEENEHRQGLVPVFGFGRIVKAAELYNDCVSQTRLCRVLISGGVTRSDGHSEAAIYADELVRLGVPQKDILKEDRSANTWQNAQFSAAIIRDTPSDLLVLVSSGIHIRRSALYFEHFGLQPLPIRGDYGRPIATPIPTAYNFLLLDLVLHEWIGVLRFHVYEALGLND